MKKTFSLLISLVACIVMVSGFSLAYLTDKEEDSQIHFTTGKLEVNVVKPTIDDNFDDWKPGQPKKISWTLKNIGTQSAFLRIYFNNSWKKNDLPESVLSYAYRNEFEILKDDPEPTVIWNLSSDNWREESGYFYYDNEVEPNEEIEISFEVILQNLFASYLGADYNISLTMEAVQANNNPLPAWDFD